MKNDYNAKYEWTNAYQQSEMAYPAEYVIRILKGNYPNLNLSLFIKNNNNNNNKRLHFCDVGCGDGRHLVLAKQCGFEISGIEISSEIVDLIQANLKSCGITDANIKSGTNKSIPFSNEAFDFLLSWNSCYYMGGEKKFEAHVEEFARIMKKEAFLILSIPQKTCFIYKNALLSNDGYCIVKDDFFKMRNGELLKIFSNESEIEDIFSKYFYNFNHASIQDDCFGLNYHWHIIVCQKK